jgi:hypothetical protein
MTNQDGLERAHPIAGEFLEEAFRVNALTVTAWDRYQNRIRKADRFRPWIRSILETIEIQRRKTEAARTMPRMKLGCLRCVRKAQRTAKLAERARHYEGPAFA